MGQQRRYAAQIDRSEAARARERAERPHPITLPRRAYGPAAIEWGSPRQVWAWVPWSEGPQLRIPGMAIGWNDRVVIFEWWTLQDGGTRQTTVWRQAVSLRTVDAEAGDYLPWLNGR